MMLVSGCATKTVVEYIETHDTLRVSKTDTLYKVKTEYSHDTLRIEVEKIVTLNQGGDTIKMEIYKDRWRDRYVAVHDTLRQIKTDTVYISKTDEHQQVITKQPSWWSVWKWRMVALALLCSLLLILWYTCKDKIKKWLKR